MTRFPRFVCGVALLALAGCAPARPTLPSGGGSPFPAFAAAYEQAVAILGKIKHLMEAAGGSIDDVVKVVIYLTDIDDREAVWKARREFFTEPFPVSTLFEVSKLVRPEMKVEIDAVGILSSSRA